MTDRRLWLLAAVCIAPFVPLHAGVLVETLDPALAESAGVQANDMITAWRPANDPHPRRVASPLDIYLAERHAAFGPGPIEITLTRDGRTQTVSIGGGYWGMGVLPVFSSAERALFTTNREALARRLTDRQRTHELAWLSWRSCRDAYRDRRDEDAARHFEHALAASTPTQVALLWSLRGEEALVRWDAATALTAWRNALASADDEGPLRMGGRIGLADALLLQRDLPRAESSYRSVMDELPRDSSGTLRARVLVGLGETALQNRRLDQADQAFAQALDLTGTSPGPIHFQAALGAQVVRSLRGVDPDPIITNLQELLGGVRRIQAGKLLESRVISVIGIMHWRAGNLAQAEAHFRTAQAAAAAFAPGTIPHAGYLNNLGLVHHARFDYARAHAAYRQVVGIFATLQPDTPDHTRALTNLALAQGLNGAPEAALDTLGRILVLQRARNPAGSDVAQTHHAMALNHLRLSDPARAEALLETALELRAANGQAGERIGVTLLALGEARYELGKLAASEESYAEALTIYRTSAPDSVPHAQSLHGLGRVARSSERIDVALDFFEQAIDAFEAQERRVGGPQLTREEFAARFSHFYKDYIDALMHAGRGVEAFHVLERYRARLFLLMLSERRLELARHWPAALLERRRELDRQYDAVYGSLADATQDSELRSAHQTLERLRGEKQRLVTEVEQRAPRAAAFHYPRPLSLESIQHSLAPGTLLLSYCITEEQTHLFAVSGTDDRNQNRGFVATTLPFGATQLREKVETWRYLARLPGAPKETVRALAEASHALFVMLLGSVSEQLPSARQILIIADGPLHMLPFSALVVRPPEAHSAPAYLIETHALTAAASATVYASPHGGHMVEPLRPGEANVIAFADPQFPDWPGPTEDSHLDAALEAVVLGNELRGPRLAPLPGSRAEAGHIAELFDRTTILVGTQASETNAKQRTADSDIVHFAVHGVVDHRFPLDSYLALAGGAGDNGLLQGWEVLQDMDLNAGLVVLSGCETALGRHLGGEGLLGLTRAFHVAGAHSVVATLWPVSDQGTSALMGSFYRHLRQGESVANALRLAKIETSTHPRFSHPFYWAGFQASTAFDRH